MIKNIFTLMMVASFVLFAACKQDGAADAATATTETVDAKKADATKPAAADKAKPADTGIDPNLPKTSMEFETLVHDFGNINQDEKHDYNFTFQNTGSEPLIISSAKGSCGCTVPEWPKEPIPPGGSGELKVQFSSGKKKGKQTKTVTIQANTDPNPTRLTIKADIAIPEGDATAK